MVVRRAWQVTPMGEMRGAYRILVGKLKEGDCMADLGMKSMILLKWILKKLEEFL